MAKQTYIQPLIKKSAKEKTPGPVQSMVSGAKPVSGGHTVQSRQTKRTFEMHVMGSGESMIEEDGEF